MGLHVRVLKPLQKMYSRLRRRFRVAGSVGKEFLATNGVLQGCPLSILLLNALVSVWAHAVQAEVPGASPQVYVDDADVLGGH